MSTCAWNWRARVCVCLCVCVCFFFVRTWFSRPYRRLLILLAFRKKPRLQYVSGIKVVKYKICTNSTWFARVQQQMHAVETTNAHVTSQYSACCVVASASMVVSRSFYYAVDGRPNSASHGCMCYFTVDVANFRESGKKVVDRAREWQHTRSWHLLLPHTVVSQ